MSVFKTKRNPKYWTACFSVRIDGQRVQKKKEAFKTKKEAAEWERFERDKLEGGSNCLFRTVANEYMEHIERYKLVKISTLKRKGYYHKAILEELGNFPISDIDERKLLKFQDRLLDKVKPQTVKTYMNEVSLILEYAIRYYHLKENPAKRVTRPKVTDRKEVVLWTDTDFNKAIALEEKPCYKTLWCLLYYTGLRIGEALALTPKDIKGNYIEVTKTITRTREIQTAKTKTSNRKVILYPELKDMLEEYIGRTGIKDGFIFPISYSAVYVRLKKLCIKAAVPIISPHMERHSYTTNRVKEGIPLLSISKQLGHSNIAITSTAYTHATNNDLEALLQTSYNPIIPKL